ncbi:MAG: alpha/beta hydrolase [Solirubrobacteraceae bacterium]
MTDLVYRERAAVGDPAGLLVLHHGRGSDERDLLGLADLVDRDRRFIVVAPRAPLAVPHSPGYHWYIVPRVGYPDPGTFRAAFDQLAALHDELWARTGIAPEQTVLGGFSMGSVMSYALGLARERPAPAGILAFSGFVPTVDGWRPSLADRQQVRAFIAHGRRDGVIELAFAHRARDLLMSGGLDVEYHEHGMGHQIDPADLDAAGRWLARTLAPRLDQEMQRADSPS